MIQEDYLACNLYENKPAHPNQSNFTQFFDEKNNLYYFAFVANDGTVLLKSEGYPQLKSCETGIASVIKNKEITERYAIKKGAKTFYLSLKAANNREIARSCDFKTEKEATEAIATISAPIAVTAAKAPAASKTKVAATKKTIEKAVEKTTTKPAATKKETIKMVAPTTAPIATTEQNLVAPAAAKTAPKTKATKVNTAVFLNENEYFGHDNIWFGDIQTGYVKFIKNDSFYFAVHNPNGSLYLASKAFDTEIARNETFDKTVNCIENGELYSVKEIENKFFVTLLDEKKNELARSAAFDTYTSAFVTTPIGRTKVEAILY
jgi:uncharacterized protein YegP (UPF0339 family)